MNKVELVMVYDSDRALWCEGYEVVGRDKDGLTVVKKGWKELHVDSWKVRKSSCR